MMSTPDIDETADWEGINSSMTCVIMGFFEGSDNHNNNVELCTEFFKPLQKLAAANSAEDYFCMGDRYYTFNIAIVLDKKELQLCSESGGGTYVTKFPCTYTPIMNSQLRDPAPYRCKQFCRRWDDIDPNNLVNPCFHWDIMETSEISDYRNPELKHMESWVLAFPKASEKLSVRRNFVVDRLKLIEHTKSSEHEIKSIISLYKSVKILDFSTLEAGGIEKINLNLMLRGFNDNLAQQHINVLSQSDEWKDEFSIALNPLQLKKNLLRYVMFEAQKWEYCNQLTATELSTQITYMPENCPPCLMHMDIRVCGKLHTAFFQQIFDRTSTAVIKTLNIKLNSILSSTDNPNDEMDNTVHREFDDTLIKIEKQSVMDFKLTCKRMRKVSFINLLSSLLVHEI